MGHLRAEEIERADCIAGLNARLHLRLFDTDSERAMLDELATALS